MVWALTFVIPADRYDMKDGSPVPGTYHPVESSSGFWDRLKDLFLSPVNGLYGVTDAETGLTTPGGPALSPGPWECSSSSWPWVRSSP